jgi:hypothetical protein
MARFKGEKVTFIHGFAQSLEPDRYPPYGTKGKVIDAIREPFAECFQQYLVEWENGTQSYVMDNLLLPRDEDFKECPIKIGDTVCYTDYEGHDVDPDYYPKVGTEGIVTAIINAGEVRVQWPEGSTKSHGNWCVNLISIACRGMN